MFRVDLRDVSLLTPASRGGFGEEYFSLAGTYFQGRPPKSVNFHWRRFRVADIPMDSSEEFDAWLRQRWAEKDALMEVYLSTGRFPPLASGKHQYIETEVRTRRWYEIGQIFMVLAAFSLVCRNLVKVWEWMTVKPPAVVEP